MRRSESTMQRSRNADTRAARDARTWNMAWFWRENARWVSSSTSRSLTRDGAEAGLAESRRRVAHGRPRDALGASWRCQGGRRGGCPRVRCSSGARQPGPEGRKARVASRDHGLHGIHVRGPARRPGHARGICVSTWEWRPRFAPERKLEGALIVLGSQVADSGEVSATTRIRNVESVGAPITASAARAHACCDDSEAPSPSVSSKPSSRTCSSDILHAPPCRGGPRPGACQDWPSCWPCADPPAACSRA